MTYRRKTFGLSAMCSRTSLEVLFGLQMTLMDGDQVVDEWNSTESLQGVLSNDDAREFLGWLQSTFAQHGNIEPELLALIGKIIDAVWLSPPKAPVPVSAGNLSIIEQLHARAAAAKAAMVASEGGAAVHAVNLPTFNFSRTNSRKFDYRGHKCKLELVDIDGSGKPSAPYLFVNGVEVDEYDDTHEHLEWGALLMATYDREFNTPGIRALVAKILDRQIDKIEAARSAGSGWNDHFGAGPYQGVLDNGAALRAVMTPEQLAALKTGGAS